MISSGSKKEMLVIGLVNALIIVSKGQEAKQDKDLTKLNNKSHKQNKKIRLKMDELQKKLSETQTKMYHESGDPRKLGMWVRSKLDSKITKVLGGLRKDTSLESLAIQILFANFCDNRTKPLHGSYKWLEDEKQLNDIFTLLEETNADTVTESVFYDALSAIAIIKG